MTPKLKQYFDYWCEQSNQTLERLLPNRKDDFRKVYESMRYSVFAGGKRLRPVLVIAGAETCGLNGKKVLPGACAMELIHTYSLIHDDLPAMDDDDLRRGRPTNHKVFGEGLAILAGDSLLTYAFDLISKNGKMLNLKSDTLAEAVHTVAEGAGFKGMVGGQVVDLEMDEGKWLKKSKAEQIRILQLIHESKTSALIQTSLKLGALLAEADKKQIQNLFNYGLKIGLAFQIADDILDIVGDKKLLGKKGSDTENRKLTYPALFGIEKSRQHAEQLVREAKQCLKSFKNRAEVLNDLADYIIQRTY